MKIKTRVLALFIILVIISLNYYLTLNPVTIYIDGNGLILGISFSAAAVVLGILFIILRKISSKSNTSYKPVLHWIFNLLIFISGGILVLYHYMENNFRQVNEDFDVIRRFFDIFMQFIISLVLITIIYEVYNFIKGYPIRKVNKKINKASSLIKNGKFKEALMLFEDILCSVLKNEKPSVYAWIKQLSGLCHMEISRLEEKRLNLLKAKRDFEDILDIKEAREYFGQIKFKLGVIYYEIAQIDYTVEYMNRALSMYESAMLEFSKNEDIDSYMDALSNADKIRNEIILYTQQRAIYE